MKNTEVYKVTFGMEYDVCNVPIYISKLPITTGKKSSIDTPVYAKMKNERLFELATGTEIPIIRSRNIPGFGAYSLIRVYTNDDYQELSYYLSKISEDYHEQYIESFYREMNRLCAIEEQFNSNHSDSFGKLSIQSPERGKRFQDEFHSRVLITESQIKDLSTGQLTLFKSQNNN